MNDISLVLRPLFGGAISMLVPMAFDDVSNFREVPDHQEVFVDGDTGASLVVELMNYEDSVSDENAASHYFHDLASDSQAVDTQLHHQEHCIDVRFVPNIPAGCTRCVAVGAQTVTKYRAAPSSSGDQLRIVMAVVRLPASGTDLLVSLSIPVASQRGGDETGPFSHGYLLMPSPLSQQFNDILARDPTAGFQVRNTGADVMRYCLHSLKVNDWSLFVA